MSKIDKIRERVLLGASDPNIDFNDLRNLLSSFGFQERIKGSHHIFAKNNVEEIINIQPKGSKAKSYQVKQIRNIILKYRLGVEDV
ncbi:MAG TPA: type II toxin-antitoxin system HicA family toxin [Pyrinomonadaceae bacterium]|jgi:predicted RNA binding protein YcfA (HicA-like mRNA interferase family)|nr:type II toxin-antitoxin system HicA family toxin [Pyrinomonadaceae bacterium]